MIRSFSQAISTGDYLSFFIQLSSIVFVVFCTLPVHEFAHAWAAVKLGDDTPRLQGRLTLNPLAHLSPIGSLMILIAGFGYAKPVPVNIRNFKNRKVGFALTAFAGPVSNLIMATIFFTLINIIYKFGFTSNIVNITISFFLTAAIINVNLAVFNLLPIPPLDGSRIATLIIPDKYYYKILQYEQMIMIGLLVLLFTGVLTKPLIVLSTQVSKILFGFSNIFFNNNISFW